MASIRKLKNGSWQAAIYIGRDSNNKQLFKYITRKSERECKAAAREYEQQLYNKTIGNIPNMKVSDYMDKWLEIESPNLASTTIYTYRLYINYHFKPYFGNMKLEQVTDMHIKEYLALKLKDLDTTTARKHFFTLKKIFYSALKGRSPCLDIKPPKMGDYKPSIPTEEEFKEIWNCFRSYGLDMEIIILLAGWCGLRRGEIFALKSNDINEKEGTITIDEAVALAEDKYEYEYKPPKSKNGIRTIVVPDYLMELLKKYITSKGLVHAPLFTMKPDYFTARFREIMNRHGLPKFRFHDLRHYHASLLYKYNVPDLYASERLGHDIWVLKRIYQHLGLEQKKEYDDKIKDIFKQG